MREVEIPAGRCRLFAVVSGEGPAVVFLHGQLGTHQVVGPLVSPLADSFQIITPDVRGRGRSSCPHPEEHSWDRYADDVVAILDALDLEQATIGGVSLGAGIALKTALQHRERVRALVLYSSVYAGGDSGWSREQKAIQSQVLEAAEAVMNRAPQSPKIASSPKWKRHDPMSLAAALIGLDYAQPFAAVEDLSSVSVLTMIIPGTDSLHPRQVSEMYFKTIQNAIWSELEAQDFPTSLRSFLDRS